MKLHDTITLMAGGPGSGRHATEGVAKRYGYSDSGKKGEMGAKRFDHHSNGNSVSINDNGTWMHDIPKYSRKMGDDAGSLESYLSSFMGKRK